MMDIKYGALRKGPNKQGMRPHDVKFEVTRFKLKSEQTKNLAKLFRNRSYKFALARRFYLIY